MCKKNNKYVIFAIPSIIVFAIIIGIIIFPLESIQAAKSGINIWFDILLPSLLPFIIGANIIVNLKLIDIFGLVLNPLTRLIFNVSGKSALILAISAVSGYPIGTKLASDFRINKKITRLEAQRLVSFCSTSGPLFIIGSVGTGMLKNTTLGYLMIICHYLGTITVGILYRNYGKEVLKKETINFKKNIKMIFSDKNESFFVVFGNAVFNGVNTLLMIGGFVIAFSVVFKLLTVINIINAFAKIVYLPLSLFGINLELCKAFVSGFFEITIGCSQISISPGSEEVKSILCIFLISFSGFCILSQCCTFLSKTDIDIKKYIYCKFLHGIFSSLFLFILYPLYIKKILKCSLNVHNNLVENRLYWSHYIHYFKFFVIFIVIFYLYICIHKFKFLNNKKYIYKKKVGR